MLIKRILMNAVDTGSGNGAATPAPAATPSEATPQAQGASTAVSVEDFQKLVSSVGELTKSMNSLHAADRRSREGKGQTPKDDKPAANPATDPSVLLAIRDRFDDELADMKLGKGPRSLTREFVMSRATSPDDVPGLVSDFVSRGGWTQQPAQPVQAAPAAAPAAPPRPSTPPVSDRGSPPVSAVPLEEQDVLSMSVSDREALRKLKGDKWFSDRVNDAYRNIRIRLR